MESIDIQAINEELGRVTSQYSAHFGHPVGDRGPGSSYGRLPMAGVLHLAKEALKTGVPVPGWEEQAKANKFVEDNLSKGVTP